MILFGNQKSYAPTILVEKVCGRDPKVKFNFFSLFSMLRVDDFGKILNLGQKIGKLGELKYELKMTKLCKSMFSWAEYAKYYYAPTNTAYSSRNDEK